MERRKRFGRPKEDEGESKGTEQMHSSVPTKKPRFAAGTPVSKPFVPPGGGRPRPFSGEVASHDRSTGLYRVAYDDGDSEDLGEEEVAAIVVAAGGEEGGEDHSNDPRNDLLPEGATPYDGGVLDAGTRVLVSSSPSGELYRATVVRARDVSSYAFPVPARLGKTRQDARLEFLLKYDGRKNPERSYFPSDAVRAVMRGGELRKKGPEARYTTVWTSSAGLKRAAKPNCSSEESGQRKKKKKKKSEAASSDKLKAGGSTSSRKRKPESKPAASSARPSESKKGSTGVPKPAARGCIPPHREWTPEEIRVFMRGLDEYGKCECVLAVHFK